MPLKVLQLYLTRKNSDSAWDIYIYIVGFWGNNYKKSNTPLLFEIESLLKVLYVGLSCKAICLFWPI